MRASIVEKARHLVFTGLLTFALALGFILTGMITFGTSDTGISWGIEKAYATKYTLSEKKLTLKVGDYWTISVKETTRAEDKKIKWSSSNARVAKVKKIKDTNGYYVCKITAVGSGTCTVKALVKGKTCKCKVTVPGSTESDHKYLMAAIGVQALYDSAKYPSTFHFSWANYEGTETNGYGEEIQRLTVNGYAMNSLGGYGDIYAVILRCKSNEHYPNAFEYEGYYYNAYACSKNPSFVYDGNLDNTKIEKAYKRYYPNGKSIPFD